MNTTASGLEAAPSSLAPTYRIGFAEDAREREAAYRLRYDVYVREMRRPVPNADHERQALTDPLDEAGHVMLARDGDRPVGTLRLNMVCDGDVGDYEQLYRLDELSAEERARTAIVTALMIERDWRRSSLCTEMFVALYAYGHALGGRSCVIDCNAPLLPLFLHYGFLEQGRIAHPYFGEVHLMRLDMEDLDHLARVGSPYLPTALRLHGRATTAS